jgi:hypothetical protein
MKISELREILKSKKKPELEALAVELYKHIPKKVLTEKEIDTIFLPKKEQKNKTPQSKIEQEIQLLHEIENFNQSFLAGHYGTPNRFIPKAKRSKWRFEVMRFYKEIVQIFPKTSLKKEFCDVFSRLYFVISEGTKYYLVNADDCFASIQKNQVEFFKQVILFKKEVYSGTELYDQIWTQILSTGLSLDIATSDLYAVIPDVFQSPMAVEDFVNLGKIHAKQAHEQYLTRLKKNRFEGSYQVDMIIEGLGILLIKIREYEEAKSLFYDYNKQSKPTNRDKEIMYYILTNIFLHYGHNSGKEIKDILDKAVIENIELRPTLVKLYNLLKKNIDYDLTKFYV